MFVVSCEPKELYDVVPSFRGWIFAPFYLPTLSIKSGSMWEGHKGRYPMKERRRPCQQCCKNSLYLKTLFHHQFVCSRYLKKSLFRKFICVTECWLFMIQDCNRVTIGKLLWLKCNFYRAPILHATLLHIFLDPHFFVLHVSQNKLE